MADIQYKGESFEISRQTQIILEQSSGYFDLDLKADYSLPIDLPFSDSPINRRLLQGLDIPAAIIDTEEIEVFFEYSGRYYLAGMVFRELDEYLTVNLYFGRNELSCFSKNCQDFKIQNSKSLGDLYNDGISKVWPATKVYFPMLVNPIFYDDVDTDLSEKLNPHFDNIINAYDQLTDTYRVNYVDGSSENNNVNTLVPQVALLELLNQAFESDGYAIKGSFFDNLTERSLFIGANRSLDRRVAPSIYSDTEGTGDEFAWVVKSNGYITIDYPEKANGAIDSNGHYRSNEEGVFDITFQCDRLISSSWVKVQLIFYDGTENVLKAYTHDDPRYTNGFKLSHEVDIRASNGNLNRAFYVRVWVYGAILGTHRIEGYSFKIKKQGNPLLEFQSPSDLEQFLPDMKFSDLFREVVNGKCLRFGFNRDRREISLDYKTDVLVSSQSQDLTNYLLEGLPISFEEKKKYLVHYRPQEEAEKNRPLSIYKSYLEVDKSGASQFLSGDPEKEDFEKIRLGLNPMMNQRFFQAPYNSGIETLLFQIRGISQPLETEGEPMDHLRLGYYLGMVDGLPLAGNKKDEESLWINSEIKSIGGRWSLWLSLLNSDNRKFKRRFLVPRRIFDDMDLGQPIVVQNQRFICESSSAKVKEGDLQEIELILRRLN